MAEKMSWKIDSNIGMVCPSDLFMVIAKLSLTGNCFLLSTKGSLELAFAFNLISSIASC